MGYATQLLHLDGQARLSTQVDIAARLARRFEGHVIGLSATGRVPLQAGAGGGLGFVMAELRRAAEDRALRFTVEARQQGISSVEVIVDDDDDALSLATHARCCDLVILGQPEPGQPDSAAARSLLERTLLGAAPPCLVIPYAGQFKTLGTQVLVAWNDSVPCTRAIIAALPFLRQATSVRLMQCDAPSSQGGAALHPRLAAATAWLARQGVTAQASVEATEIDVGNALLSRCSDLGVDLLVAGAWSHSRLGERLFGGVTRTLLDSMTVPVLMSH